MAITFNNKPPKWENGGIKPTDEKISAGYEAGDTLPADYLNYHLSQIGACIEELQTKLNNENAEREKAMGEGIPTKLSDLIDDSEEKRIQFAQDAAYAQYAVADNEGREFNGFYAKKTDVPTKITDLVDDTNEGVVGINYAKDAGNSFGLYGGLDGITVSFGIQASTEDLTAGTSPLSTGCIYIVYE